MAKSTANIRMLVWAEKALYSETEYFHVKARPVKMVYEEQEHEYMPWGTYWLHEGDPFYDNLQVSSQGSLKGEDDGMLYGFEVEYVSTHVRLYDAEQMVKVLRQINRKLEKMNAEFRDVPQGDIASFIARVAKAMGITSFGFYPQHGEQRFPNGSRYNWVDARSLGYMIDARVKELRPEQVSA